MTDAETVVLMASPDGPWSKADIERLLAAGSFKYQNIQLPYGLLAGSQDRLAMPCVISPDGLAGKATSAPKGLFAALGGSEG